MIWKYPQTIRHLTQIQFGFTLIEFIVVMSIISLIFGIGIVRYQDFNRTQTIKSAGLTFKNELREIQGRAVAGVKPATCTASLDGYRASFGNIPDNSIQQDYIASMAICGISYINTGQYDLPKGIGFSDSIPGYIDFLVLGKGTTTLNSRIITISTFSSPVRYYSLCVASGGDIIDCGYSVGSRPTCSCT